MVQSPAFQINDIELQGVDLLGETIERIYAKVRPHYAVYRTQRRVAVAWSQDDEEAKEQRNRLTPLNVLRNEITGLVDGWRSGDPADHARALRYDGRVAAALVVALEGDATSAVTVLTQVKSDILDERTSAGRFDQLKSGLALQVVIVSALALLNSDFKTEATHPGFLVACSAGGVGAFFSLAIGINGRTVVPNLIARDNILDPLVRGLVGVIAAGVLYTLLHSELVTLSIGRSSLGGSKLTLAEIAIVGFLAGFIERLVPDLLQRTTVPDQTPASQPPPLPGKDKGPNGGGGGAPPDGRPPGAPAVAPPSIRPPSPDPRTAVG